jgi:hypothetical protein
MSRRRVLAVAVALAVAALLGWVPGQEHHRGVPCQEDEPCWSWPEMGTRSRGVVLRSGARAVVGPCRYRRLARGGLLDGSTPRLRGDRWALRHGC